MKFMATKKMGKIFFFAPLFFAVVRYGIRDPNGKKSGSRINIQDPQHYILQ
jgi:hypothetical protein